VLRSLERQARRPDFQDYRARFLNFAGDQCVRGAMHERGSLYYGLSINAFVASERFDAASAICRKLVRIIPHVVRARCTLTWLAIAKGLSAEAEHFVREYAAAAEQVGVVDLAEKHIRSMVDLTDDPELCWTLGDTLLWLGDESGADDTFGCALRMRAGERAHPAYDELDRQTRIRRILLEDAMAA
ncbi:MAG: hypothetical protein ACRELX_05730, partial [Longimicrobiales bacterium]